MRTDCEEAELPSLALAASFCLSSLISFSSSLSLLSSWARPRSRETDGEQKDGKTGSSIEKDGRKEVSFTKLVVLLQHSQD